MSEETTEQTCTAMTIAVSMVEVEVDEIEVGIESGQVVGVDRTLEEVAEMKSDTPAEAEAEAEVGELVIGVGPWVDSTSFVVAEEAGVVSAQSERDDLCHTTLAWMVELVELDYNTAAAAVAELAAASAGMMSAVPVPAK